MLSHNTSRKGLIVLVACLVVLLLVPTINATLHDQKANLKASFQKEEVLNVEAEQRQYWFDSQKLDHFAAAPTPTWRQRYFVIDQYFNAESGPLLLYICGEGQCNGISKTRGFPIELADKLNGIVITLEHRFYGASQPFGYGDDAYSTEHLRYLSHDQALEDLAYFIGFLKWNNVHGVHQDTPVLTIGGSYPGALSAWFRYKYRHLTIGALASSAVVNAILNFKEYDNQIRLSTEKSGQWCPDGISSVNNEVQSQLSDPLLNIQLKRLFQAEMLSDDEFLGMIADTFAGMVQYGNRTGLCNYFIGQTLSEQVRLQRLATVNPTPKYSETVEYLKNTTYDITKNGRQWTFQTCTFFGWYQTASDIQPMRSRKIDIEFYKKICQKTFGDAYWPVVNVTNLDMGSVEMRVNHIIFTNGVEDPWKWASITHDAGEMEALVADCTDCAHCVDLSTPSPTLPPQVTNIQNTILGQFRGWIQDYWRQKGQNFDEIYAEEI